MVALIGISGQKLLGSEMGYFKTRAQWEGNHAWFRNGLLFGLLFTCQIVSRVKSWFRNGLRPLSIDVKSSEALAGFGPYKP